MVALLSLKNLDEDKFSKAMDQLEAEFDMNVPKDKAGMNKRVAEENGITVGELINSPNYQTLLDEYRQTLIPRTIKRMAEVTGLTEIQCWALFAKSQDLI